jgi:alpha-beta hydrolase superfamily lysophospholipase
MHAWRMTHFAPGASAPNVKQMSLAGKLAALFAGISIPRPINTISPDDLSLAFSTHRFVTSDGMSLEAWLMRADRSTGSRGVVILFHGYTTSKASVLGEAKVFHDLGYDALLVDMRGAGGSSGNVSTVGYLEANDVSAAVDFAKRELAPKRTILYGQSMGAVAILRAIAKNGVRPDAMILECPFDRLLTTVSHRFTMMHVPAFGLAHLLVFWGGVQQGYWGFSHNPIDYAGSVRCPALVMSGANDPWVLPDEARDVLARMRGERRFALMPGVGHEGAFPRCREQWTGAIASFLKDFVAQPDPGIGR